MANRYAVIGLLILAGCVPIGGGYYSTAPGSGDAPQQQFNNFVDQYNQDQFMRNAQDQYNDMVRWQNDWMRDQNEIMMDTLQP